MSCRHTVCTGDPVVGTIIFQHTKEMSQVQVCVWANKAKEWAAWPSALLKNQVLPLKAAYVLPRFSHCLLGLPQVLPQSPWGIYGFSPWLLASLHVLFVSAWVSPTFFQCQLASMQVVLVAAGFSPSCREKSYKSWLGLEFHFSHFDGN